MKILMYAPVFPPTIGGPATQCSHLCRALAGRGHAVVVVTPGDHFSSTVEEGYRIYRYRWQYTGTRVDKVIRWTMFPFYFETLLRRERPDVLHAHSVSILSFMAAFLARRRHIPRIIKFAGDWVWETLSTHRLRAGDFKEMYSHSWRAHFLHKVERWGMGLFDVYWAPSHFRAENIEELMGRTAKIRIIPNALVLHGGGVREVQEGQPFIVVSANRFIPHKRISMLIRTFALLKDPQARLVLIGTGAPEEVAQAERAANKLGVAHQVRFAGRLASAQVYEEFKNASVYLSASLEEGFPNVFIEAMYYGLPIIATDVGGCREMVVEGKTGYLTDPQDEEALAERLDRLRKDVALRNTFAHAAVERARLFDLTTVVAQFESLYTELCARP